MKNRIYLGVFFGIMISFIVCFSVSIFAMYKFFSFSENSSYQYIAFADLIYAMIFIIILAIVFSLLVAFRISSDIVKPINNIDLNAPDERDVYGELRPLVKRINAQNRQIQYNVTQLKNEHEKQNKMRREFTANVSHELKTPLTSISGYAEIIRDGYVKQEDIAPFAGKIYDEAQRLITLVGDIINLSRLDEREIEIEKNEIDLYTLALSVAEHLHPVGAKRGIDICVKGSSAVISGAYQIIEEIIYNLCDNAIKYNKDNGNVVVTVQQIENKAIITVKDTGIGIPEDELDRVFERFYRVDKSHSKEIGGTGLGLSIVKNGVLYHNGDLKIQSEVNKGTEISIVFNVIKNTQTGEN